MTLIMMFKVYFYGFYVELGAEVISGPKRLDLSILTRSGGAAGWGAFREFGPAAVSRELSFFFFSFFSFPFQFSIPIPFSSLFYLISLISPLFLFVIDFFFFCSIFYSFPVSFYVTPSFPLLPFSSLLFFFHFISISLLLFPLFLSLFVFIFIFFYRFSPLLLIFPLFFPSSTSLLPLCPPRLVVHFLWPL